MKEISFEELEPRLKNNQKVNLIDVRELDEHTQFNIGGILLPLGNIQTMQIDDINHLRNEEVICYCRSGKRSFMAAMMLEQFGFTNVKNLTGGMLEWAEKAK